MVQLRQPGLNSEAYLPLTQHHRLCGCDCAPIQNFLHELIFARGAVNDYLIPTQPEGRGDLKSNPRQFEMHPMSFYCARGSLLL